MSELSTEQLKQLWRHSIPLSRAPVYFGLSDKKSRYENAKSTSTIEAWQDGISAIYSDKKTGHEALFAVLEGPQKILSERDEAIQELKADVIKWGNRNWLRAVAFQPPRRLEDAPIVVPTYAWNGHLNWEQSKITHQSIDLIEVRVTTFQIWQHITETFSPLEQPRGRPSMQKVLALSINGLIQEGNVDTEDTISSHIPKIRKLVELHARNQKMKKTTLGDEAIRKAFSPVFKDLKGFEKL